ncbi:MAG: nitrogenase component 1 [Anaerocolumna sp.]
MGLYKYAPEPSGRMGLLWALGTIKEAVVLEFGSMGHMLYAEKLIWQATAGEGCKLYTTHLDEKDIALGITKRFTLAVKEIVEKENPKIIFVLPSTVPEITGVDMEAVCDEVRPLYEDLTFIVLKKGSFHEKLHHGIEETLYRLAKEVPNKADKENKTKEITVNIIGSCLDLAKFGADILELRRILKGALGLETLCVLTSDTSITQMRELGKAHLNLVLRREGIKAAEELSKTYQMDYVYGTPYGYEGTVNWLQQIANQLGLSTNQTFIEKEIEEGQYGCKYLKQVIQYYSHKAKIIIGGNYDVVRGIKEFATKEIGLDCTYSWCNAKDYGDEHISYQSEEDIIANLDKNFTGIIMADRTAFRISGRETGLIINRSLDSRNFNKYESPYMGFRGAMNLCSLWLEHLL